MDLDPASASTPAEASKTGNPKVTFAMISRGGEENGSDENNRERGIPYSFEEMMMEDECGNRMICMLSVVGVNQLGL